MKLSEELHIAVSQRIVRLHCNDDAMSLAAVRAEIERCAERAATAAERKDCAVFAHHLKQATGLSIEDMAEVTKRWPT
jgi:hypothetical protein